MARITPHKVEIRPIRAMDHDESARLHTNVLKIVGYQARCLDCDYAGKRRITYSGAMFDRIEHAERA